MWHHFTLTVPADTPEASPEFKTLQLSFGVIKYIAVVHPRGCKAMVNIRIFHEEHQVFPNNPEEAARGDNVIEGGELFLPLYYAPYTLKAKGTSPDTSFAHNIPIYVLVLPPEVAEPWAAQLGVLDKFKLLFGVK
jgi:hypothetical protein